MYELFVCFNLHQAPACLSGMLSHNLSLKEIIFEYKRGREMMDERDKYIFQWDFAKEVGNGRDRIIAF